MSDGDLKKIESEFAPKVAYLQLNDAFSPSHAAVLRRMHLYRNEIYHDDKVRPATVEAAAKIYTYVVCDLMQRSSSSGVPIAMSAPTPSSTRSFPSRSTTPPNWGDTLTDYWLSHRSIRQRSWQRRSRNI